MGITTMHRLAAMAGQLHPQLRRNASVRQGGRKTMPERVEGASTDLAVTAALDGL